MRKYLTFGNIDSRDYGVYISGSGRYNIPEKAYTMTQVPGKMGDVPINGRRVNNMDLVYPAFFAPPYGIYHSLQEAAGAFRTALLTTHGYAILQDSYDLTHYRKGVFVGGLEVSPTVMFDAASFDLTFNVDPRHFAYLPTVTVSSGVTKNMTLTEFPANVLNLEPIIEVTGTGTIEFTDGVNTLKTITITQNPGTVVINSQLKECYAGSNSANNFVQFSDYQFPIFGAFYGYAGEVTVITTGVSITIDPGGYEL